MKTLTCDVCRHQITTPVLNRNYFHLAHREVCETCHDLLEAHVKPTVRTKLPFDYQWYNRLLNESLEKAIQKGKF